MTDETTIVVAFIASVPPTIAALVGLRASRRNGQKVDAIHVQMNSRLDELLAATRISSHAQGVTDEQARVRQLEP